MNKQHLKPVLIALLVAAGLLLVLKLVTGQSPGVTDLFSASFTGVLVAWTFWQYARPARHESYVRFTLTLARAELHHGTPRLHIWRLSAEEKIRVLRDTEIQRWIVETCREFAISDLVVLRGIQRLCALEFLDRGLLREFGRGNRELKEALAEALLAERIIEHVLSRHRLPAPVPAAPRRSPRDT